MSIRARLKKLERGSPSPDRPFFIITRYADETEAEARAAYPELPLPSDLGRIVASGTGVGTYEVVYEAASILYAYEEGRRPSDRPHNDRPAYSPSMRAVVSEVFGTSGTFEQWKAAAHEHQEQAGEA